MASRVQRFIFPALLGILALLGLGGGLWWWLEGRHWQSTDNAYVEADIATIAAKVPGYIASVPVSDNQPVKKGDALATIVDAEYRAALAGAEAEVERQRRARGSASAEVSVKTSSVAQSEAALAAAEANARRAAADAARAEGLLAQGWVTRATAAGLWRSSNEPIPPRASCFCPAAGWLSGPSLGWAGAAASAKIGSAPSKAPPHGQPSPASECSHAESQGSRLIEIPLNRALTRDV